MPHGVWLNKGTERERFLGAVFSGVDARGGDRFTRPSARGGGFGDPLERERLRAERRGWLAADAEEIADRFRAGELDVLDVIRRHGVILDWDTGELFPKTTEQFRAMLARRMVPHWH